MKVANVLACQSLEAYVVDQGAADVANTLDTSVSHLYRILAGKREPGLAILARAEEHYDIPLAAWSQRGASKAERRRIG